MNNRIDRIIDCHTHLLGSDEIDGLLQTMNGTGLSAVCLLAQVSPKPVWWAKPDTPAWYQNSRRFDLSANVASMLGKAQHPDKVFVFGGLDYNTPEVLSGRYDFAEQARTLIDMGVDGFKMWMGPYIRMRTGLPLDAPEYDDYYALLESASLPILYHAGPRPEIEGFLRKHPKLKVIFAHFFGGSRDLEGLASFLDAWPNTCVDLAPGRIFRGLSDNRDAAREFFIKYQDRILYGTDNAVRDPQSVARCQNKARFIRRFLERKDDLQLEELGMSKQDELNPALNEEQRIGAHERWAEHGLYLEEDVLAKIYAANFERMASRSPRGVNPTVALAETEKLLDRVRQQPDDVTAAFDGETFAFKEDPFQEQLGPWKARHLQELERIATGFRAMTGSSPAAARPMA